MRRRRTDSLHSSPFTFHPSLKPPSFVPPAGGASKAPLGGRLRTAFFDRFCDFILLFVFRCAAENLRPPYMAALQSRRKISGQRRRAAIYRGRPPSRPQTKFQRAGGAPILFTIHASLFSAASAAPSKHWDGRGQRRTSSLLPLPSQRFSYMKQWR